MASRSRTNRFTRLRPEVLEDRLAPATLHFLGVDDDFMYYLNWREDGTYINRAPTEEDDLRFENASQLTVVNLTIDEPFSVASISLSGGFTLTFDHAATIADLHIMGGTINFNAAATVQSIVMIG